VFVIIFDGCASKMPPNTIEGYLLSGGYIGSVPPPIYPRLLMFGTFSAMSEADCPPAEGNCGIIDFTELSF